MRMRASMPNPEDIDAQGELLQIHRRNLAHYTQQQALHGGVAFVPPAIANGIVEARAEIAQIKATLRSWGQIVDDHPNDLPAGAAPTTMSAPGYEQPVSQSDEIEVSASVATHSTTAI